MPDSKGFVGLDSRRGLILDPRLGMVFAGGLYLLWAWFLFAPHYHKLSGFKFLYLVNSIAAAFGTFLLSRRWLADWTPSALSGLFYGFGPFGLSFTGFHPIAGLTFAAVPWLLLPAVYWHRGKQPTLLRFGIRALLCVLPFAFIAGFFWVLSRHWVGPLFLMPSKITLTAYDLKGLLLPLSMAGRPVVLGLYHVGLLGALMGLFVYLSAQRIVLLVPPIVGLVLAFLDPILFVSPVLWAALPMVFLAILGGLGVQAFLWAGKPDAKWVLACTFVGLLLGGVSLVLYLPQKNTVYLNPTLFYLAASACIGVLFLLIRQGFRWLFWRWVILVTLAATDCFLSAQWFVDSIL
jgi:hypothetical protein